MFNRKEISIFGKEEHKYYIWFRQIRDKVFSPLADIFNGFGVKASHLSLLGKICMIPFVLLFQINPWLSVFFLVFYLFLDSIDGVLARAQGKDGTAGAFVDFTSDYFVYFVVFFTFLYYGLIGGFWGALHLLNYLVMQFLIVYANFHMIEVLPVLRSKLLIYLFFLIWLISGVNYFDPLIVLLTVYMLVTNFFLYHKIRWAL